MIGSGGIHPCLSSRKWFDRWAGKIGEQLNSSSLGYVYVVWAAPREHHCAGVAEDTAGSKADGSSAPRSGAAAAPWVWIEKWVNRGGVNRAERWKLGPMHGQVIVSARASCDGSCRCVVMTTSGHERPERIKMPKRGVNWANSKFSCNN